jgi:tyrosyl-tRNA synthetase
MTVPILEGLDGVNKMSKSLNNYIALNDPPKEMFGKLMSVSDSLMWRYYDLLSFKSLAAIAALRKSVEEGANPRDIKMALGVELVDRFHGAGAGERAKEGFMAQFSKGELPENIPEFTIAVPPEGMLLARVLKEAGLVASNGEGNRMIEQKAVRVDSERVEDKGLMLKPGGSHLLQVGSRRYARVVLKAA